MKRFIALMLCVILALSLCACDKEEKKPSGVPDNVITPSDTQAKADSPAPEVTDSSDATDADVTAPAEEPIEEDITSSQDENADEGDDVEVIEEDYKAIQCLEMLNSDKVHAKFVEAVSYDGEYVTGSELEMYVLGDQWAYITDGVFITATWGEDVAIIDYDNGIYCVYEGGFGDEEEEEYRFGYGAENYVNISSGTDSGVLVEVFEIETFGGTITSTWTFNADSTITVVDLIDDSGAYYYYTFEVLETSFTEEEMQRASALSAPTELEQISVEEYEGNY